MTNIKTQIFKLNELNPAKYNPRKQLKPGDEEFEKLKNSIKNFGYVELIVVNIANNNTVISGHQRLSVLKYLGETEAECVVVELNEEDEKALNIAMNKVGGSWDEKLLADLLAELKDADYNLDLTGFNPEEIDSLFSKFFEEETKEDNFNIEEELQKPVFSHLGDLWVLGKHKIFCGDSTKPETYTQLMNGEKANLLLTDPPYLVSYKSKVTGSIKNDALSDDEGYIFLRSAFEQFKENLSKISSAYVFYASAKSRVFYDAFEDAGFRVFCSLVWKKNRAVMSRGDFNHNFEPIIYGTLKDGTHRWYGDQKQTTCFEFDTISKSAIEGEGHPTSKPVPLMVYLIKQSTLENSIVLDGFHGSGSTMIACEQLNRQCRAVELDEKFVDVQVRRYIKYKEGKTDDVYVIRDGQKLNFEDVVSDEQSNTE